MSVKLRNEVEEKLWSHIYKVQFHKSPIVGEQAIGAQHISCAMHADEAILQFRAKQGDKMPAESVVPIITGTPDEKFYKRHLEGEIEICDTENN